ncbi:MAG: xanthine dehydrogenase family protein molybdopterin-binding subunit [Chloroflexi bacterium]|nr:xanthine dehydrogenase family protein molybdopterin-binding subunit [Chloroflexota bacterium]
MADYAVIGQSLRRVDGAEKVTGQARYTGDLQVPGLLHARLVLSPYASARIVKVDAAAARGVPGVVGVYTAEDLPFAEPDSGSRKRDFMARGQALYHGHPVACVVAETAAAAQDALALVEVEYEPRPAAVDLLDAMQENAPHTRGEKPVEASAEAQMHATASGGETTEKEELPANVSTNLHFMRGDVEQGFREADVIVEQTYRTSMVHQGYIEPQVTLAAVDPLGTLTIYTSTQALFYTRAEVCAALGLPNNKVKVVGMTIGGGFGGKFMLLEALAAAVALKTGRPVRLEYSRMDDFLAANPAPPSVWEIKLGAKQDGTITALKARVIFDTGAYSGSPIQIGSILLGSSYRFPNLDIRGYEVLTNKTPAGAYRAPGAVQAAFAIESTVDMLANALGMDRLEFRKKNAVKEGDLRSNNQPWPKIGLPECLAQIEGPWKELLAKKHNHGRVREGVGIAIGGWPGGIEPATAVCRLNTDGTISVVLGSIDLSGTDTSFKQIAAEAFGVNGDMVEVTHGDTDAAPYAGGSGGSKITYTVGAAVQRAAEDARHQVLAIASQLLEAGLDDLEIAGEVVRVKGVPNRELPLKAVAAASMSFGGKFEPVYGKGASAQSTQSPGFAVHLARVAIDTDTGKVTVLDYVAAQDVGKAINPAEVEGQIVGGVLQGIGQALYEQMAYDESGQLITGSLLDYAIPSAGHAPTIKPILVEVPSAHGPYGAKGVGEPPVIPAPATIANAVADAIGVRLSDIPITSQAVAAGLRGATGQNGTH